MRGPLHLRPFTSEEERVTSKLARSQSASKQLVERSKIIQLAKAGRTIPQIVQQLRLSEPTVRKWWKRFEQQGLVGLEDAPRSGAPLRNTAEQSAGFASGGYPCNGYLGHPFRKLACATRWSKLSWHIRWSKG